MKEKINTSAIDSEKNVLQKHSMDYSSNVKFMNIDKKFMTN